MKTLILFLFTIGCFAQDTIPKRPDLEIPPFKTIEGKTYQVNWWGLNYRNESWYIQYDLIDDDFNHFEYECKLEDETDKQTYKL